MSVVQIFFLNAIFFFQTVRNKFPNFRHYRGEAFSTKVLLFLLFKVLLLIIFSFLISLYRKLYGLFTKSKTF